ncbi:hypothetical protein [Bacillus alkalicellulosilyticus]|uniref:hypothetical protein n=1 Tax=Alkalihalobacterium alkalicellulosilyticum TaxID=1912214 RepID=UPI0014830F30|nr:hypothetical protein [Bacillus alkalicellulosilyticus]
MSTQQEGEKMTEMKTEKRSMYKRLLKRLFVGLLFIVALGGYGVYWAFFDMNLLPKVKV